MFEIEIFTKKWFKNSHGERVLSDILGIGIKRVTKVEYSPLYVIDGDINSAELKTIALELLCDKIVENYVVKRHCECDLKPVVDSDVSVIKVWYKKGVTDTVSESVVKAVKDLGIAKEVKVKTGHKYYMRGKATQAVLDKIATKLLANTLIQEYKTI
ncbi:MAG: phosphoribosylformylglycinamidine synthase subunit PurS [Endomicrobium sp.]|nr:phosphoribosylformylglycinamidine synthase subunit PurS [Endomicrobium sp.]